MRTYSSADAKNSFGKMVDFARLAPVAITKYDRPFVVVMAVEEYERLMALDGVTLATAAKRKTKTS